jgi:hypothetical protein
LVVRLASSIHSLRPVGFAISNLKAGVSACPDSPNPNLQISLTWIDLVFVRPENEERTFSSEPCERVSVCDEADWTTHIGPRLASNAQNGMDKNTKKLVPIADIAFAAVNAQMTDQSNEIQNDFQRAHHKHPQFAYDRPVEVILQLSRWKFAPQTNVARKQPSAFGATRRKFDDRVAATSSGAP